MGSKKGIVFTLEALVTFTFFLMFLYSVFIVIQQKQNAVPLYETVVLNDLYQVLELKYHSDISRFAKLNEVSPALKKYLNYVKDKTGHIVFMKFGKNEYFSDGSDNCTPVIVQKRLLVYFDLQTNSSPPDVNYFHELTIGLCN